MDGLLVINAGSSSIKFGLFDAAAPSDPKASGVRLQGRIERLGARPSYVVKAPDGSVIVKGEADLAASGIDPHEQAIRGLLGFIERHAPDIAVRAVGHRVVHGGPDHAAPARIDAALLAVLAGFVPLAPLHQPHNLAGIEAAIAAFPDAVQVACFDTAFHRAQPWVADTFALPRRFYDEGVRRYGFHGLSYDYIARYLRAAHPAIAEGRVVVAHLGNGASLCAMENGLARGSTMGFTAVDGMPMGTRTGQLDPGVIMHLLTARGMTPEAIAELIYKQSGLLGLSGISGDWRLLEEAGEGPAAEAIAYFTHRALREIGGLAATMGGLDALVFTAGIGENASGLRRDIANGLAWLGARLDAAANAQNAEIISTPESSVTLMVVPTDEEGVIASHTRALLAG